MPNQSKSPPVTLLLAEPDSLLRSTVASAARQLNLAEVQEATRVAAADRLLKTQRFGMLMLALDAEGEASALLNRLHGGHYASNAAIPTVVLTHACDGELVGQLKSLQVSRIILKPFKARTLLDAISSVVAEAARNSAALSVRD